MDRTKHKQKKTATRPRGKKQKKTKKKKKENKEHQNYRPRTISTKTYSGGFYWYQIFSLASNGVKMHTYCSTRSDSRHQSVFRSHKKYVDQINSL